MAAVVRAGGEMGARVAEFDWSSTSLGPMEDWPPGVRSLVGTALTSRFPIVLWFGPDLLLVYNDAYLPILGEKHPGALGRPGREVWSEIWDIIGPMLQSVVDTGVATWSDDQRLAIRRGGFLGEGFFTFTYSPIHDDAGAVSGVFCAVHETTHMVVVDRRLRALGDLADRLNEAHTEQEVYDVAAATLASLPQDLPFLACYSTDDEWARRRAIVGSRNADAVLPERLDLESAWLRAPRQAGSLAEIALEAGPGVDVVNRSRGSRATVVTLSDPKKSDPIGWLVCGLNPLQALDDDYRTFLQLVGNHISGGLVKVRALELERERGEALAEIDRAKTRFFSNISHEFRTPLTLLLAPLEEMLAADGNVPLSVQRSEVEIAHRNGLRLLELVNRLLDFSRLEAGRLTGRFVPVDLGAVTEDLASVFRSAIESAGLRFDVRTEALDQPTFVDLDMWEKIVFNLLSNALKYTFEGRITVAVEAGETGPRVTVSDTGIGIAADDLERIFERFYRVSSSEGRSVEGAGIGLSLARDLVELHGGTLTAESTPRQGTTFTITLRSGAAHLPAHQIGTELPGAAATAAEPYLQEINAWLPDHVLPSIGDDGASRSRAVVLVVDDNADMRTYLHKVLSAQWDVLLAADGSQGLDLAKRHTPDVVVTDVMMRGLDGLELVRRIRADDELRDTPVLMLSARAGSDAAVEGLDAGAHDYLVKPFTASELVARVQARIDSAARLEAEAEQTRRSVLLGDIAAALNTSRTMAQVTRTLFDHVAGELGADLLNIGVLDPVADAVRVHVAGQIPTDLRMRYRVVARDAALPIADVLRTGQSVVLDHAGLRLAYPDAVDELDRAGIHNLVGVPLQSNDGTTVGSLTFTRADGQDGRPFSSDEVTTIMRVAAMCADAIERVRLYELARQTSDSLQHGLLQLELEAPQAVWCARYRPVAEPLEVGGDWYDVFALDDDRLGVTIGDVVGQGLAAATTMGQLRSALSAVALDQDDPASAIDGLDRYARRVPGAHMATVAYAIVDPVNQQIHYHAAGHPPPLLVTPDGHARLLEGARSWPLIGAARSRPGADTVEFPPGSLLVLYTDGLVERRHRPLGDGLDAMVEAARAAWNLPVGVLCDAVLDALCGTEPARDDIAMVAVRTMATHDRLLAHSFPSDPSALAPTRHRVRRWLQQRGLTDDERESLLLAIGEACTNAIEHGHGLAPDRLVDVELAAHDGQVIASITDSGAWSRDPFRGYQTGRGRGFTLMQHLVDHVAIDTSSHGTTVTLSKAVTARDG
jgi:signal transduction histidine kinase/DNA-binding NarL/FixJ family response regulator